MNVVIRLVTRLRAASAWHGVDGDHAPRAERASRFTQACRSDFRKETGRPSKKAARRSQGWSGGKSGLSVAPFAAGHPNDFT